MTPKDLAHTAAAIALSKKAKNVQLMDISKISDVTDFFVLCSGDSDTHVKAIADEIDDELRSQGIRATRKEGYNNLQWVLLDFFDVVVHVFQQKIREYYQLERLWGDAEITYVEDSAPSAR